MSGVRRSGGAFTSTVFPNHLHVASDHLDTVQQVGSELGLEGRMVRQDDVERAPAIVRPLGAVDQRPPL